MRCMHWQRTRASRRFTLSRERPLSPNSCFWLKECRRSAAGLYPGAQEPNPDSWDPVTTSPVDSPGTLLQSGPTWLENSYLRIDVDPGSGRMSLLDKVNDRLYKDLNHFVDGGDVGDLYNYCPPLEDRLVDTAAAPPLLELVESGSLRATLRVRQIYRLPASCSPDRETRSSQEVDCEITTDVSLDAGSRRLDLVCSVENAARDHRLRVLFPVPFVSGTADAEGTFGVIRRPAVQVEPAVGERPWSEWAEFPVNTHAQKRFVDLSDGKRGLAVLNRGLPEYEIVDSGSGSRQCPGPYASALHRVALARRFAHPARPRWPAPVHTGGAGYWASDIRVCPGAARRNMGE